MRLGLFHYSVNSVRRTTESTRRKPPSALAAYQYILRQGQYSPERLARSRNKFVAHEQIVAGGSVCMPGFAKQPADFWEAADEYERANGRLAIRITAAIPRDVPPYLWVEMVRAHVERHFSGHPVTWAIHKSPASDKGENPHVHFLVCERGQDGIPRTADRFFRRANPKNPEQGGAKKERGWTRRDWIGELRLGWQQLTNDYLEAAGSDVRLDARSNAARGSPFPPQIHVGPRVLYLERRGVRTERRLEFDRRSKLRKSQRRLLVRRDQVNEEIRCYELQEHAATKCTNTQITTSLTSKEQAMSEITRASVGIVDATLHEHRPDLGDVTVDLATLQVRIARALKPYILDNIHWLPGIAAQTPRMPPFQVRVKDGSTVVCDGKTISGLSGSLAALEAIAAAAEGADLKAVSIFGSEADKAKLYQLLTKRGIRVVNYQPQATEVASTSKAEVSTTQRPEKAGKVARNKERLLQELEDEFLGTADDEHLVGISNRQDTSRYYAKGQKKPGAATARYAKQQGWTAPHIHKVSPNGGPVKGAIYAADRVWLYLVVERHYLPSQISGHQPTRRVITILREYYKATGETPADEILAMLEMPAVPADQPADDTGLRPAGPG